MADLCCRRFVLAVLDDTVNLLPIQNMADQIHSFGNSTSMTKQKISWQKLQGLTKKIIFKVSTRE